MAARYCKLCGAENPPEALECEDCGAPLPKWEPERPEDETGAPEEAQEVHKAPRWRKRWFILLPLAAILLVGAVAAVLFWRLRPETPAFAAKSEAQGAYLDAGGGVVLSSWQPRQSANWIVTRDTLLEVDGTDPHAYYTSYIGGSADGSRSLYFRWDGVWTLYDRGSLERLECRRACLSGDGRYLFLLLGEPEGMVDDSWGKKIVRRTLESGAEVTVAEGEEYTLGAAGYDGSRLFYWQWSREKAQFTYGIWMGKDTRWVEHSYQTLPGSSRGAIFQDSIRWSNEPEYLEAGIGWPDGRGETAIRWQRIGTPYYDKDLTAFLYQKETGRWCVETAQGSRDVTGLGKEITKLEPLRPSRSEELPERILDWVYIADGGEIYYLSADCVATRLGQAAYYRSTGGEQTTAIDPAGTVLYYLFGGDVYRVDRPRTAEAAVTQLTQKAGATRLYADRDCRYIYFLTTRGTLCYLPQRGQPVQLDVRPEQVQVTGDGLCWFGVSMTAEINTGGYTTIRQGTWVRLWYSQEGREPVDTGVVCDRLISLGADGLVAAAVVGEEVSAWRLEKGTVTELPRQEALPLPPYEPAVYGDLDEDDADLPPDDEEDRSEWDSWSEDMEAAVPEFEEVPEDEKRVMWIITPEGGTGQIGVFTSGDEGDVDLDDIRAQMQSINGGTVESNGENDED